MAIVSAVAVHSGLPCAAARSMHTALQVMKQGPDQDVEAVAGEAREAAQGSVRVPLVAVHGRNDDIVSSCNAQALVRQYLRLNGHPAAAPPDPPWTLPPADEERVVPAADGHAAHVREWRRDGRLVVRYVELEGLGHAWSGGDAALPFNDARPPDAMQLLGDFFTDAVSSQAEGGKRRWLFRA